MTTDSGELFDASVGLAFSLKVFETYRKSGMLSAEIRSLPGIRGKCIASLELIQGKVVSCYLIDKAGERHPGDLQLLVQLDAEKGPFGWAFRSSPEPPSNPPISSMSAHQAPAQTKAQSPVPKPVTRYLDPKQLQQWTPQQQMCIYTVFSLVNGQNSIDEIKKRTSLPPTVVDETIRILLFLRAIVLQQHSIG